MSWGYSDVTVSLRRLLPAAAVLMTMPLANSLPSRVLAAHPASPRIAAKAPKIIGKALLHDTRDNAYRAPFGAVPAGTSVMLALRTAHDGAAAVSVVLQATDQGGNVLKTVRAKMKRVKTSRMYDTWRVAFRPTLVARYGYYFQVALKSAKLYYGATALQEGGAGEVSKTVPDTVFRITSYEPSFKAASWAQDAVIYQIFPDRFYNGDPSNDTKGMNRVYGGQAPYLHTNWTDAPLPGGEDFFGGDLQGIIDKLPYLKSLGVNTLYLNPVFLAPSNHKYDTADYMQIDPRFGTQQTFDTLMADAHTSGMHVILDGVFNHTGSDSVYFNRYGYFPTLGAYQSQSSPYFPYYTFNSWPNSYDAFFGIGSLPQLNESDAVKDFIFRTPDSVAQHWLAAGANGWRLDAAHLKSHAFWKEFRTNIKARFPDSTIICECDAAPIDATPWLMGNEMDGDMNYRFREAILDFFAGGRGTSSPFARGVTGMFSGLMSILEDYPKPAILSSMNLVDSHDTDRILYDLNGNKQTLREIATLQMTWLGAPTVYYGDETGLSGAGDPDDRRTFPWDSQDTGLTDFYRNLIGVRKANPALRDGTVKALLTDDKHRFLVYERTDNKQSVVVALNDGPKTRTSTVKVAGLKNGTALTNPLTGQTVNVSGGAVKVQVQASGEAILVQTPSA